MTPLVGWSWIARQKVVWPLARVGRRPAETCKGVLHSGTGGAQDAQQRIWRMRHPIASLPHPIARPSLHHQPRCQTPSNAFLNSRNRAHAPCAHLGACSPIAGAAVQRWRTRGGEKQGASRCQAGVSNTWEGRGGQAGKGGGLLGGELGDGG